MNTAVLAVAGARKTQSIVDLCSAGDASKRRLVLTYTLTGQRDLEERLRSACGPESMPTVSGWYSFLLRHWVRPFLPLKYPGRRLAGLNFEGLPRMNAQGIPIASGESRFLDSDSRAYKRFLSKLAVDVADVSDGIVLSRLQRSFDEIYIDEIQDMTGYDLVILEKLLTTTCSIRLIGDLRQSVFSTNAQDPKYAKFRGLKMIDWFHEQEKGGHIEMAYSSETWRSNQAIADFSDTLFESGLGFPPTVSRQTTMSEHDGIFAVAPEYAEEYMRRYNAIGLRQAKSTVIPSGLAAINFGVCKGQTFPRVIIFTTGPIRDFLIKNKQLADASACGLYVGVTRAVYSVAFVMDKPQHSGLPVWSPAESAQPSSI